MFLSTNNDNNNNNNNNNNDDYKLPDVTSADQPYNS